MGPPMAATNHFFYFIDYLLYFILYFRSLIRFLLNLTDLNLHTSCKFPCNMAQGSYITI